MVRLGHEGVNVRRVSLGFLLSGDGPLESVP